MTAVLHDLAAEQTVAACAASSLHGAQLAAGRLGPADFYDPRCAAVTAAGVDVPNGPDREHQIAAAAGVDPQLIADWCAHAPVMWDTTGAVASRVARKAADRRRVLQLLAELEDLGVTTRVHGL